MLPISNKGTQSYVYLKMWSGEVIVYDLSISGEHNWKSLASSTSGVCGRERLLAFHGQPCFCQWHDRSEYMVTANYRYGSAWLFIRFNTNTPRLALNSSDKSWSHVVVLNETKTVWKKWRDTRTAVFNAHSLPPDRTNYTYVEITFKALLTHFNDSTFFRFATSKHIPLRYCPPAISNIEYQISNIDIECKSVK